MSTLPIMLPQLTRGGWPKPFPGHIGEPNSIIGETMGRLLSQDVWGTDLLKSSKTDGGGNQAVKHDQARSLLPLFPTNMGTSSCAEWSPGQTQAWAGATKSTQNGRPRRALPTEVL